MPRGIVAGQAWECEPRVDLAAYQRAKTGALFAAATMPAPPPPGPMPSPGGALGERLGEAYQVADDIGDAASRRRRRWASRSARTPRSAGPTPSLQLGLDGAIAGCEALADGGRRRRSRACPGAAELRALILSEAQRLLPKDLARRAA